MHRCKIPVSRARHTKILIVIKFEDEAECVEFGQEIEMFSDTQLYNISSCINHTLSV
jgi:hypothetical protein